MKFPFKNCPFSGDMLIFGGVKALKGEYSMGFHHPAVERFPATPAKEVGVGIEWNMYWNVKV